MAPPPSAPAPQSFPATPKLRESWPDRLAVSPDGRSLLVPLNLADVAAVVDTSSHRVRYIPTGTYPYGAAILPGGRTGLVSNEGPGTVSVVSLSSAKKLKDIQVGANLSHPEGIALSPGRVTGVRGDRQRGPSGDHRHPKGDPGQGAVG